MNIDGSKKQLRQLIARDCFFRVIETDVYFYKRHEEGTSFQGSILLADLKWLLSGGRIIDSVNSLLCWQVFQSKIVCFTLAPMHGRIVHQPLGCFPEVAMDVHREIGALVIHDLRQRKKRHSKNKRSLFRWSNTSPI